MPSGTADREGPDDFSLFSASDNSVGTETRIRSLILTPKGIISMNSRLCLLFCFCLSVAAPLPAHETTPTDPLERTSRQTPEQLDRLLGPVALYPDALIALILPATTVPSDVVLASRYLRDKGDPAQADDQAWDDSLKALVRYPDVINWLDQNLAWTKQVGEAFLDQPADVMNSIQRLRARARAAGALIDTPEQQVVVDGEYISIIPAQPDVIYVPYYDPEIVYVSRSGFYSDPFMTFGIGYATGFWLGYDFDWGRHRIWTIDPHQRDRYWRERRDWRRPVFPGRPGYIEDPNLHPWNPRINHPRPPHSDVNRPRQEIARPSPFQNGPQRPHDSPRNIPDRRRDSPPGNTPAGPHAPEPISQGSPANRPTRPNFPDGPRGITRPGPAQNGPERPHDSPRNTPDRRPDNPPVIVPKPGPQASESTSQTPPANPARRSEQRPAAPDSPPPTGRMMPTQAPRPVAPSRPSQAVPAQREARPAPPPPRAEREIKDPPRQSDDEKQKE